MIRYYKNINEELKEIKNFSKDCWVKVIDPNEKEIDFLINNFKLERDLVVDGLDIYELPRVEEENKKSYIYLNSPTSKIPNESSSSFLTIVSKMYFITICKSDLEIFERLFNSRSKILLIDKEKTFLHILSFISITYSSQIRNILKNVKKDRRNIKNLKEKDITSLVIEEDRLNDYLSGFNLLLQVYSAFLRSKTLAFDKEEREFIGDLKVDLNQTFISCKSTLKMISNIRDYYQTAVSNRLNRFVGILTIFTVFLTIPTVLSGIYGMNIPLPLQNTTGVFWILTGIILLIWVILFYLLKKIRAL
jgi:Mg2+ and Co2+ transporter CorA